MTREEILLNAKPILFNTEMVRAILDGRKTVTRRLIKPPVEVHECTDGIFVTRPRNYPYEYCRFVPYEPYKVGDYLYVRETWAAYSRTYGTMPTLIYKADGNAPNGIKWRPSIHMPKEAARIFLRVTSVRVERLQDITEDEARAEGFSSKAEFISAITKMYPNCSAGSWFWVIEYERVVATQ